MNVWICIAYDPILGIDHTTRLLRYGALAEQLASSGHSVVMWTSTFDHWRKIQRFDADRTVQVNKNLRVELLHAPSYAENVSWARVRHNRILAARFTIRAKELKSPDIIFAGIPCLELTEATTHYAQDHRVPMIVDIQDIWPEVYVTVLPRQLRSLGRFVLSSEYKRAKRIFKAATAVTAVSRQYLDWACALRGEHRRYDQVFHLGYRLPAVPLLQSEQRRTCEFMQRLRIPEGRILVTFVGQFAASYDVDTIIGAARLLETGAQHTHFVLAGSGDKYARIKKSTQGLSSVTLTGWLEHQDTITLLQKSQIGLAAYSLSAPQSLPYKPFEYMAFGLPIISSLPGELREIIANHGIGEYYQAGDAYSLATAVNTFAQLPEKRELAGRHARELYDRQFDGELITNRLIGHLETVSKDRS